MLPARFRNFKLYYCWPRIRKPDSIDASLARYRTKMTVLPVDTNVYIQRLVLGPWWGTPLLLFCIHGDPSVSFRVSMVHIRMSEQLLSSILLFFFGCMRSEPRWTGREAANDRETADDCHESWTIREPFVTWQFSCVSITASFTRVWWRTFDLSYLSPLSLSKRLRC